MTVENEFKKLFERLQPDLKPYMRFTLTGTVVAVYEDEYSVDVEFDEDISLPHVPVHSLWAEDGWGIWVLPEVDSEVEIGFTAGDVTRPYVISSWFEFREGKQIQRGYKVGMFAIVDKQGQRIEFKPDELELSIKGENIKIISAGNLAQNTLRNHLVDVGGDQIINVGKKKEETVKGSQTIISEDDIKRIVKGHLDEEINQLTQKIKGDFTQKVGGSVIQTISNNLEMTLLGARIDTVAKQWQAAIGGNIDFMITNANPPSPTAFALGALLGDYSLKTNLGNFFFLTLAGLVSFTSTLGFSVTDAIAIALTAPTINVGGVLAIHPAAKGDIVKLFLSSLMDIIAANSATWCLDPVSGAIPLTPALIAAFETLALTLDIPATNPESLTVKISP